jgi:hypothetical protein
MLKQPANDWVDWAQLWQYRVVFGNHRPTRGSITILGQNQLSNDGSRLSRPEIARLTQN